MRRKHFISVVLFFITSCSAFSQTIIVKIYDSENKPLQLGYAKIYCKDPSEKLLDFQVIRKGILQANIKSGCSDIQLTITASGYNDFVLQMKWPLTKENDTLLAMLTKTDIKLLEPVIVKSIITPVTVKNDTTIYQVSAFTDGTEKKLDELLKKLPGIEVNEKSGEVKFKGKPVETILLEGDNLFGSNYTLGTKNINANIVEEVQAIENYSDNYVLKGLEKEEKVALNIKVKNAKLNISGNLDMGLGIFREGKRLYDISTNLIGLKQTHKFFGTLSYNNSGQNKSPVDYFGNNLSVEQIKDKKYAAEKFIPESGFSYFINDNRANSNSQFFSNYNGIFPLSKKISLKANLYYLTDKVRNAQTFENEYFLMADTILNKDITAVIKAPKAYKVDLYARDNISSKSLLEYTLSAFKETTNSDKTTVSNFVPQFKTDLFSKALVAKHNLIYTQRVTARNALQINFLHATSNANQDYKVNPSVYKRFVFTDDTQASKYRKKYISMQAIVYGVNKKRVYNFSLKNVFESNRHHSNVVNDSLQYKIFFYESDVQYDKNSLIQSGTIQYNFGKWKLSPAYSITYLGQRLRDKRNLTDVSVGNLLFEPNFKTLFRLSKIAVINAGYSVSRKAKVEKYIFTDNIIQTFRSVVRNIPSLDLITTQNMNLTYLRSDLYNQFDNSVGLYYQTSNKDYLPTYLITDSIIYSRYAIEHFRNEGLDIVAYSTKYFPKLRSTIKVSVNYSANRYYNFVNALDIRSNNAQFISYELFYKSIFKGKINIENTINFSTSVSESKGNYKLINHSIEDRFKLIFRAGKQIKMSLAADYYRQNVKSNLDNLFLDYNLSYIPKNKKTEFRFIIKNLLNETRFSFFQVSDFSKSRFSTDLLPRYAAFYFSLEF